MKLNWICQYFEWFHFQLQYEVDFPRIVLEFFKKIEIMSQLFINLAFVCHLASNKVKSSNSWKKWSKYKLNYDSLSTSLCSSISIEWLLITWISCSQAETFEMSLTRCVYDRSADTKMRVNKKRYHIHQRNKLRFETANS